MGENLCSLSKFRRQKEKTALGEILSKLVKLDTLKMSKVIFYLTFAMGHDNLTAIKSSLLTLDKKWKLSHKDDTINTNNGIMYHGDFLV